MKDPMIFRMPLIWNVPNLHICACVSAAVANPG